MPTSYTQYYLMSSIILSFTWVHIADKKQPENASNAILSRGFSSENHVLGAKLRTNSSDLLNNVL